MIQQDFYVFANVKLAKHEAYGGLGLTPKEFRKYVSHACDGHRVRISADGPWHFYNHTYEELNSEKVLMAMDGLTCPCAYLAVIMSGMCIRDEIHRHITLVPCERNILGAYGVSLYDLLESEFFRLQSGWRYLRRARRHQRIAGTRDRLFGIDDIGGKANHQTLADEGFRRRFIDKLLQEVKAELKLRGVKTILNKRIQQDRSYHYGRLVQRMRFAKGGNRTFLDLVDANPEKGRQAIKAGADLRPLGDYIVDGGSKETADKMMELIAPHCAISQQYSLDFLKPYYNIVPRLTGLNNHRTRSQYDEPEDVYLLQAHHSPEVFDVTHIADCVEAGRFQSLLTKVHGPRVKAGNMQHMLMQEFAKRFEHRNLRLELNIGCKRPGYTHLHSGAPVTKRVKLPKGYNVNFTIRGTLDQPDDRDSQRIRTFLNEALRSYDSVQKLK